MHLPVVLTCAYLEGRRAGRWCWTEAPYFRRINQTIHTSKAKRTEPAPKRTRQKYTIFIPAKKPMASFG